jgi:outer membrane biosynthesis protein TonB
MTQRELDELLRNLQRSPRQAPNTTPTNPNAPAETRPVPPQANIRNNPNLPVSSSDRDRIKAHVEQNTVVDPGMQGLDSMQVEIRVWVDRSGQVERAEIAKTTGAPASALRSFAEAMRRAAIRSSPLPMPRGREEAVINGQLVLVFHGREMANR